MNDRIFSVEDSSDLESTDETFYPDSGMEYRSFPRYLRTNSYDSRHGLSPSRLQSSQGQGKVKDYPTLTPILGTRGNSRI